MLQNLSDTFKNIAIMVEEGKEGISNEKENFNKISLKQNNEKKKMFILY